MSTFSTILPVYAADTAGVCSMLYELGGMVVVHDASGCNSTYATHDEPRWQHHPSRIFISALTEQDAILGNDQRLVDAAAKMTSRFPVKSPKTQKKRKKQNHQKKKKRILPKNKQNLREEMSQMEDIEEIRQERESDQASKATIVLVPTRVS